jgi:hypothetical protein
MSREAAAIADRSQDHSHVMLDDCRLQLSSDNIFRYCAQNGMPKVSDTDVAEICLRTAAEIEAERLTRKKAKTAPYPTRG